MVVELQELDREILITIADCGRGISPEALREIMVQAQRPELFLSQKGKRVGLGLAIAFQVVRAHRGRLHAESLVGAGSRFTIALPLEPGWDDRYQRCRAPGEWLNVETFEEETT